MGYSAGRNAAGAERIRRQQRKRKRETLWRFPFSFLFWSIVKCQRLIVKSTL
jgi:hypothetical protein